MSNSNCFQIMNSGELKVDVPLALAESDCEDSCPKPIPPPEEKKCLVWGIDCLALIMTGVFVVCSASFLVGLLISNKRSSRRESEGLIRRDGLKILSFFFGRQTRSY